MKTFLFLATILLISACSTPPNPAVKVNNLADRYVETFFTTFPELAAMVGAPDLYPEKLSDRSFTALKQWEATENQLLDELNAIDRNALNGMPESITYGFLRELLEASIGVRTCRMELWKVSPTYTGWQNELPFAFSSLPIETEGQRDNLYQRLTQLPRFIRAETINLKEGIRLGYTAPKTGVEAVIGQMDALLSTPADESPFASFGKQDFPEFHERLTALVEMEINPAIAEYRDYLQNEYLSNARIEVGANALPDGDSCYKASTRFHITSILSAETIHQMGLDQMEKIQQQLSEIGERSFGTSDPAEVLRIVKEDPKYRFSSREEIIQMAEEVTERAEAALPNWFGKVPEMTVEVVPYPSYQEKNAPLGQALFSSRDEKSVGQYIINTYEPETQSKSFVESLSFHEAHPGHLFQMYVAKAGAEIHPITSYFFLSGFGEGWALYTERLAEEMGLYTSDVSRVGWLASEAHRSARLVVDSGMHAMGWTRQESIDYLAQYTTLTPNQTVAETDRYIAAPGQATSYMVGALEILNLRSEAEQALGEAFDIKAFHDLVLEDGTIPLAMLQKKVRGWIEKNK
ncbi:MAG: DUF885 domain-containing protein [Flavobacteriia bacterium]|nr:DUF885 domain-containing protein [Flavobacteriia bacterium]